jgi:hypothetical protein|tara:strand:- start:12533 stop:12874 length:342 start_codon:yes stop_codon:yes gene_type:complete
MINKPRIIKPTIYSVSFEDVVDLWIESMHPVDHLVVIWDAKNHLGILKKSGFSLSEGSLYNNKILTIVLDDVRDCFYTMDVLSSYSEHPYIQIYSEGRLLTDNLDELRPNITN